MSLRRRMAMLMLAVGLAAAPSLGLAAEACGACVCPPTPCADVPSGCETAWAGSPSCCQSGSEALPSAAKRSVEAPPCHAVAPGRPAPAGEGIRARPPARAGDFRQLVSPLRLSVVLRV